MFDEKLSGKLEEFFQGFPLLTYKKKEVILSEGGVTSDVFYIESGFVRVYHLSEEGNELSLAILKQHDLFPLTWGLENIILDSYLEAMTPLRVWRVPRLKFLEFLSRYPDVYSELFGTMSARLGGLLTRIEYMVTGHAYTKVAATVLVCARRFGEKRGTDVIVGFPLTQHDIATLVGITRETTCLEMKKLERKGLISHKNHLLIIKDMARLEKESAMQEESAWMVNNAL